MGWTEYHATKWHNGRIDRRAECRDYIERNSEWGTLVKDAMIGSTWYGAVKLKKTGDIVALIMLTSERDNFWFGYKDMDESMHPYYYDCPESILKLLSPTDCASSISWREECHKKNERRRMLNRAKKISVTWSFETTLCEANKPYEFHRRQILRKDNKGVLSVEYGSKWYSQYETFITSPSLILKGEFTVIE